MRAFLRGEGAAKSILFLGLVYAWLMAYMWLVVPAGRQHMIVTGGLCILIVLVADPWARGETLTSVGLTFRSLLPALRLVTVPTLVVMALLVAVGLAVRQQPDVAGFGRRFLLILPWALLQQGLLQATFNRRLTTALGDENRAALVNGLCFGGMHLPGPFLTVATTLAGAWWSRVYQRQPNLWALVLSHALMSAAAQSCLPAAWTHGFRVGPGYYRWP